MTEEYIEYPYKYFVQGNDDPESKAFFILCAYDKDENTPLLRLKTEHEERIGFLKPRVKSKTASVIKLKYENKILKEELKKYIEEINKIKRVTRTEGLKELGQPIE